MVSVRAGVIAGSVEEMVNGYVYQSKLHGTAGSWAAIDRESGVAEYLVSVGTTECECYLLYLL